MSAQHTPGPWSIFDLHDETRLNVRGPNEEFVADCADGFYSDETDDWVMAVESLPNARLISAAPDLLEALSEAIDALDASRGIEAYPDFQAWEAKARAAIAKATGTSSEDRSLHGEGGR
jgi:hypothetical protein